MDLGQVVENFNAVRGYIPEPVVTGVGGMVVGALGASLSGKIRNAWRRQQIAKGNGAREIEILSMVFFPTGEVVEGTRLERYDVDLIASGDYNYKDLYTSEDDQQVLIDYMKAAQDLAVHELENEGDWRVVTDYLREVIGGSQEKYDKIIHDLRSSYRSKFSDWLGRGKPVTDAGLGEREVFEMSDVFPVTVARLDNGCDLHVQTYCIPKDRVGFVVDSLQIGQVYRRKHNGERVPVDKEAHMERIRMYMTLGRRILNEHDELSHFSASVPTGEIKTVPVPPELEEPAIQSV